MTGYIIPLSLYLLYMKNGNLKLRYGIHISHRKFISIDLFQFFSTYFVKQ